MCLDRHRLLQWKRPVPVFQVHRALTCKGLPAGSLQTLQPKWTFWMIAIFLIGTAMKRVMLTTLHTFWIATVVASLDRPAKLKSQHTSVERVLDAEVELAVLFPAMAEPSKSRL